MWYVIYRMNDGLPVSFSSTPVDPATLSANNWGQAEYQSRPPDNQMWDAASRSYIPRPLPVLIDRLQDLTDDPDLVTVWQRLTAGQRTLLRNVLIRVLGTRRYREASEMVEISD